MAQREQVFFGQPPIFGGGRLLPSPSQFYLTGEDRLRIICVNSQPGVTLAVQWRTANPDGSTTPSAERHTPQSDRTVYSEDHELGVGSLLNVTVFALTGAPLIGQTYVSVQLIRGAGAAAIVLGTILGGYVTTTQALGFPGSPIVASTEGEPYLRIIAGTTPAPGGIIAETVPAGARWEVLSLFFVFATSAAVADRRVNVAPLSGSQNYAGTSNFSTVPASTTNSFSFAQNLPSTSDPVNNVYQGAMMERLLLLAGAILRVNVTNGKAGDQFSGISYVVREWLEVS